MKTKDFVVKNDDGTETAYFVSTPSAQDVKAGKAVYNTSFTNALKSKSVVRAKLDDLLVEQGLWNDDKQRRVEELQRELLEAERRLDAGGIPLSQAKEIAMNMKKNRGELRELISVRTTLDNHTAEGQADSDQFNFFVSACTFKKDGRVKAFASYDDFLANNTTALAVASAQALANLMYGLDDDYESNLPENEFLKKFKFVDKNLRLINKEGKFVDADGRLVDQEGRYVDGDGNYVDKYGHRIDKEGNYIVEHKPFLDDDGNPVPEDEPVAEPVSETPETPTETASENS